MAEFSIEGGWDFLAAPITATATTYTIPSFNGESSLRITGTGFTYDPITGAPTGGTISSIEIILNLNGGTLLTMTNINVSLGDLGALVTSITNLRNQITWFAIIGDPNPSVLTPTQIRLLNADGTFTDIIGAGMDAVGQGNFAGTVSSIKHIASDGTTVLTDLAVSTTLQLVASALPGDSASSHAMFLLGTGNNTIVETGVVIGADTYGVGVEDAGGNDTITTQGGVAFRYSSESVVADLLLGTATVGADVNTIVGASQLYGSDVNDNLAGDNNDNVLSGEFGNDILTGRGGGDTLLGSDGDDIIDGGDGNDIIAGEQGDDAIDGGAGTDIVSYFAALAGVTVNLSTAAAQNTLGDGVDTITNVENVIGSEFNDTLTGSVGTNLLLGGLGNDTLDGGAGADQMFGGEGDDTYHVDNGADVASEPDAGFGTDLVIASVSYTLGANIDNLTLVGGALNGTGNILANTITGNSAANQLFGLAGNDVLDGGAGADSMFGGEGADAYLVDNAGDIALEANVAWGTDLVLATVSYALGQNIDHLTLLGSALVGQGNVLGNAITGNALGNTLFGFDGNDILNGLGGVDSMFGGLGDDTYVVDNAADQTFEAQSNWGNDTAQTSVTYQLGQNIDNLVLQAGAGALTGRGNILNNIIIGNESANTLFGFAGNDTLNGGLGADQLYGREGDDTYIVDNVNDVVSEANAAWGTDTIQASVTYFLAPNLENLTLTGGAAINGNGNTLNNVMTGNGAANTLFGFAGADTLDGGAGADSLFGGEGDDLYIVDNAGDVGFEGNVAWGLDLVQASVSHVLGTNLDNLTLTGASAINGTGNNLANVLTGNGAANTLSGLGGADTLNGGAGNDTLDGGAGDDAFIFAPGSNSDTVTGFIAGGAEDSINLSAYNGSGVTWSISQAGADTVFSFSNGDQITLTNVTAANLVQTDPFGYS